MFVGIFFGCIQSFGLKPVLRIFLPVRH